MDGRSARCAATGKINYPSWEAAAGATAGHKADAIAMRTVYRCPKCRNWHTCTRGNNRTKYRKMPLGNAHRSKANRR